MTPEPLNPLRSIKAKLGALVAVTICVAAIVASLATAAGASPWLVVPVAVGVGLVVTQLLARGMTAPLRNMTVAAGQMAAGDYSQRVHTTSRDEVGELTQAFNRMAATLEQVNQQRRDLVANVSHELRTPIAALQAVLENMADGVSEPDPKTLQVAAAQTDRLGRLVADLLDLSRIEEGIAPFDPIEVELQTLIDQAVDQARDSALNYTVDVEPGLAITADPQRLHQLLANLLSNANRHTPRGSMITISARRNDSDVVLSVLDQGPGIPESERDAVFERFATNSAQASGTGLGLAIARWVTDLHGGTIAVADNAGPGARIEVRLPVSASLQPPLRKTNAMTTLTPPAPQPAPQSRVRPNWWPDVQGAHPRIVAACATAGLIAGLILPNFERGIGWFVVWATVCAAVWFARGRHSKGGRKLDVVDSVLIVGLLSQVAVRDAEWLIVQCLFVALAITLVRTTGARTVMGVIASGFAVPTAGIRGLPWLGRSLVGVRDGQQSRTRQWMPVVRAAVISVVLLAVFAALFASADAVFAGWVSAVVPDLSLPDITENLFVGLFIAGGSLAACYVALSQPRIDELQGPARPSERRYEWLAPLVVVNVVFAAFLIAQATAMFGGHDYVQRSTGLTYADYVHRGFGEMTVATILTITVIGWVARRASASDPIRNAAAGLLGVMALVVVASALYRMSLYMDAYGFTTQRLAVSVFEGWLGAVLIVVLVGGALGAKWIVPASLRLGAAAMLGLALINPEAWIARHNLDRDTSVVGIDYFYLASLSADAYPVLAELQGQEFTCATLDLESVAEDAFLGWNWSRSQAREIQETRPPVTNSTMAQLERCATLGSSSPK